MIWIILPKKVYLFMTNTTFFVTSGKCKGLSYSAILEFYVYVCVTEMSLKEIK